MSSQDIRPDDLKKLNKGGIRTVGDVRKTGVDELTKSLGLHSSMRFALRSIIVHSQNLPLGPELSRIGLQMYFVSLGKNSVGVPPLE